MTKEELRKRALILVLARGQGLSDHPSATDLAAFAEAVDKAAAEILAHEQALAAHKATKALPTLDVTEDPPSVTIRLPTPFD